MRKLLVQKNKEPITKDEEEEFRDQVMCLLQDLANELSSLSTSQ